MLGKTSRNHQGDGDRLNRLRPSLGLSACAAALLFASIHGCGSDADDPTGNLTAGGSAGVGGNAATGGTGNISIDADLPDDPKCKDPDDKTDTDGDGIADQIEDYEQPGRDTDGDGTPDREDTDSDDDGISDADEAGRAGDDPCVQVTNSDREDLPDFQDSDSDGDGLPDQDEQQGCPNDCRTRKDCDGDPEQVIDLVEKAAGGDPCDGQAPSDAGLYFVVPYLDGEKRKRFEFSTGVKEADIYFLIDTTVSMQGPIDNIKQSLDTEIIPTILNGDPNAKPPIPAIPGAHIGIGSFKDVPWIPWGGAGDPVYEFKYDLGGPSEVYGNVSAPENVGGVLQAPDNVKQILASLNAAGGGDAPESTTQALWLATTNDDYRVTAGGEPWPPADPPGSGNFDPAAWRQKCAASGLIGRACFRPGKLPVFVIITDAGLHNGPTAAYDYVAPPSFPPLGLPVAGTKSYTVVLNALNAISAKIVGITANTGTSGQARADLNDLATKTGSEYYDAQFGGKTKPLVTEKDTSTGDISTEVVRLIGLLAGQGLNNVTTERENYACPGSVDCDGDFAADPQYQNIEIESGKGPFDATRLIKGVEPVEIRPNPPYASIDATTFFGIRGDAVVEFEVIADNSVIDPRELVVVQALLRVQTPSGLALGGKDGVKRVYLVIPPKDPLTR